jgi:hypothetical protein
MRVSVMKSQEGPRVLYERQLLVGPGVVMLSAVEIFTIEQRRRWY